MKAIFSYRESSTGKYTSITIAAYHADADEIIECYKQAVLIEGIKSL
jgi:putative lipoic acid-binding regulatory protein